MDHIPTINEIKGMSDEEVKTLNKKLMAKVALSFGLFFGLKLSIMLLLRTWAKKAAS